jgi:preprotein translocase subunit SecG
MRPVGQEIQKERPLQEGSLRAGFMFPDMWLIVPVLLVLHVIVCVLLVLVVLMQLPRSEGLGAAFGGAVTENIFGAQTTHVLAKFTVWLGVAFFAITLALAIAYSHRDAGRTGVQRELLNTALPSPSPAAAAPEPAAAEASPAAAVPEAPATQASPAAATPEPTAAQAVSTEKPGSPSPSPAAAPAR